MEYRHIGFVNFNPKIFLISISICAVISAGVGYFFHLSFWITFPVTVGAVFINGLIATWEDRRPGGFENPQINMETDDVVEIKIDKSGKLFIKPLSKKFPYIYREAMEINWDDKELALHSPINLKDWGYVEWARQIFKAAREQNCNLRINSETQWVNVPDDLKKEITSAVI